MRNSTRTLNFEYRFLRAYALKFYARVIKIEAMYEVSRMNVKIERGSVYFYPYSQPLIHCLFLFYFSFFLVSARKIYLTVKTQLNIGSGESFFF